MRGDVETGLRALTENGRPFPADLFADLVVASRAGRLVARDGQHLDGSWGPWLSELFIARGDVGRFVAHPMPLARALSARAAAESAASGDRPDARRLIRGWVREQLAAGVTLQDTVGHGAWLSALRDDSPLPSDGVHGVLASLADDDAPAVRPRIPGTAPGGVSRRIIRASSGRFLERAPGRLPENPGRLAPIEHAYRAVEPGLFLERLANAKLLQSFGNRTVDSTLRASLMVTLDIGESADQHRLRDGEVARPVDVLRAIACAVIGALAARCEPLRLLTCVRIRRWPPWWKQPREDHEIDLTRDRRLGAEPAHLVHALSGAGATFVQDVALDEEPDTRRVSLAARGGRWDAAVRIVLGDVPAQRDDASPAHAARTATGFHARPVHAQGRGWEIELRQGGVAELSQAQRIRTFELDAAEVSRWLVDAVLGIVDREDVPSSRQDLLGGLS